MLGVVNSTKIMVEEKKKNYYTTQELVAEPWFPIRSTLTVKKLIEEGKLTGYDVSTNSRFKRYRITKESVERYMREQVEGGNL